MHNFIECYTVLHVVSLRVGSTLPGGDLPIPGGVKERVF